MGDVFSSGVARRVEAAQEASLRRAAGEANGRGNWSKLNICILL